LAPDANLMTAFTEVSVVVDGEAAEVVSEMLRPFAYQDGVVLEQQGDQSNPDPQALEPDVTVKIFILEEKDTPEIRQRINEILYHLNRLYPVPSPSFRTLQETDWANAWKEHYHPFRVGSRIWIQPSWHARDDNETLTNSLCDDDVLLVLDPGMAFGTGLHPTTQKCLRALEKIVRPGDRVLDVGTGSGILSIAAAKLGAATVTGVDTDELSIKTAVENARQNKVSDELTFWQGELASVTETNWDVVVVNILAPVIVTLLENDELISYVRKDGRLVLSGIIDTQLKMIENAVTKAGGTIIQKLEVRDWVTLVVRPNSTLSA
jgi:ribosomal protein L11 methyltransferase